MSCLLSLTPYLKGGEVSHIDVMFDFENLTCGAGEALFHMQTSTVTIPGCPPLNTMLWDDGGEVPFTWEATAPYPYELLHCRPDRALNGPVRVSYTVEPRPYRDEDRCGPYFDLRAEADGFTSSGLSFLADFTTYQGDVTLHWDLSHMQADAKGVCTWAEGDATRSLEDFRQCYYACGTVHCRTEGDFGFYWLTEPSFDIEAIARYTRDLFGKMQVFFRDDDSVYRIFMRKDPYSTSGGTALKRSYLFGWNDTQPVSVADKQNILAHEMVHNWPHLNDNPYGTSSWYSEGTAEFYSVMLPLRAGLISVETALSEIQRRTDDYYRNPTRHLENMEAARICWQDRRAQRLPYGRGIFFLANTDVKIRQATNGAKTLDNVVLRIQELDRAGVTLSNQVFLDTVKELSGLDVTADWEIMRTGTHFAPLPGSFDGHFDVEEIEAKEADTGKPAVSYRWKIIERVGTDRSKQFTPATLCHFQYLSWPVLSPEGDLGAYVIKTPDAESGNFIPQVCVIDFRSDEREAENRQARLQRIADPAIADETESTGCIFHTLEPGSRNPYFVSNHQLLYIAPVNGEDQVFLVELKSEAKETAQGNGRPFFTGKRQLTHLRHGVIRAALSPDGRRLAAEATLWPEDKGKAFTLFAEGEKENWQKEMDMQPYCATELVYKMDEWYGMRKGEYSHLCLIDLESGEGQVLPLDMEAVCPAWSHDGTEIAFYGYPYHDAKGYQAELFLWDAKEEKLRQITRDFGFQTDQAPIFTKDDQGIIGMAYAATDDGSAVEHPFLCRLSAADDASVDAVAKHDSANAAPPSGQMTCTIPESLMLPEEEKIAYGIHVMAGNRTENGDSFAYAYLSEDGEWLYFLSGRDSRQNIYRLNLLEKGRTELVQEGDSDIQAFYRNEKGQLLTLTATSERPSELFYEGKQWTDCHGWLGEYAQGKLEEFVIKSRDKETDLHYYLLHPACQEEGKLYPAVLDIHGGPTVMFGRAYWHEFHALSAAGFAVIYGDPRGSVGYGREFCNKGVCWTPKAMEDLEDILADAISRGFIDAARVGVTGGSYGGYMTNKLIGRTGHFAAAVTQRSLANPVTSYGTGDMGFVSSGKIPKHFKMLDYLEDRARGNIISFIDNMKTPLLILHAYRDYRCSFEQGEQLFIAMKERNPEVPCRLVMFPEENHALTRTGKLHNQIRHLQEMVDWFVKYLHP